MGNNASTKKRVCIIGAGPAGLVAIKEFSSNSEEFEVVCMEELSVVGGLWNYSPLIKQPDHSTGSNFTAVYKNLRTQTPKQLMSFSDLPFQDSLPSFLHHSDVKEYLSNYARTHKLQKYIKFNTRVKWVRPKAVVGGQDGWLVEAVNVLSNKTDSCHFDIVVVCNGIHFKAHLPTVKGMREFKGRMMHSQDYRDPEDFRNKKVMVMGAGMSGMDIAVDVSKTAQKVWLSHKCPERKNIPASIEQVREILELTKKGMVVKKWKESIHDDRKKEMNGNMSEEKQGDKRESIKSVGGDKSSSEESLNDDDNNGVSINLQDTKKEELEIQINGIKSVGIDTSDKKESEEVKKDKNEGEKSSENDKTETNKYSMEVSHDLINSMRIDHVDVVIFCTGFEHSLPFLTADCGVSVVSKQVVSPLYKDLICLGRQTLSFIGLHQHGTIPLFEAQAKFLRAFYEETFKIPPYGKELLEMVEKDDENKMLRGVDVVKKPLCIVSYQWQYMNDLARMAGFEKVHERFERLFYEVQEQRKLSQSTYQDKEYELAPDGFYAEKKKSID